MSSSSFFELCKIEYIYYVTKKVLYYYLNANDKVSLVYKTIKKLSGLIRIVEFKSRCLIKAIVKK